LFTYIQPGNCCVLDGRKRVDRNADAVNVEDPVAAVVAFPSLIKSVTKELLRMKRTVTELLVPPPVPFMRKVAVSDVSS